MSSTEKCTSGINQWTRKAAGAGELFGFAQCSGQGNWSVTILERGKLSLKFRVTVVWLHLVTPSVRVRRNRVQVSQSSRKQIQAGRTHAQCFRLNKSGSSLTARNQWNWKQPELRACWYYQLHCRKSAAGLQGLIIRDTDPANFVYHSRDKPWSGFFPFLIFISLPLLGLQVCTTHPAFFSLDQLFSLLYEDEHCF